MLLIAGPSPNTHLPSGYHSFRPIELSQGISGVFRGFCKGFIRLPCEAQAFSDFGFSVSGLGFRAFALV